MLDNGKALSPTWGSAQKEDIGSGFKRANKEIAARLIANGARSTKAERKIDAIYRKLQLQVNDDERQGVERHRFLNGNSRFIFYVIQPPKIKRKPRQGQAERPVNAKNTISPTQRLKFAKDLGSNIDRTTKFFVEDILPKTGALLTGLANADEVMQQIADEKAKLPLEFIKKKAADAVFLRIIRFISQQYGLTKEEQKLMVAEFVAKSKPPLF